MFIPVLRECGVMVKGGRHFFFCAIFAEVVDGAKVLKMFLFRCKSCLINISRCFMKFEAKWTTPVAWAEIQFKFWH